MMPRPRSGARTISVRPALHIVYNASPSRMKPNIRSNVLRGMTPTKNAPAIDPGIAAQANMIPVT